MLTGQLRSRLHAGELLTGVIVNQPSPDLVELCGLAGFDFAFIDAEHGILDDETCLDMVRAADTSGAASLVRVARNEPDAIAPYLEMGASGVLIPHVSTPEAARAAVAAVKFYPDGERGAAGSSRANAYGLRRSAAEYFSAANRETVVAAIIEDSEGIANMEAIGNVPGIDLVIIGPGDLALSMGHGGDVSHPDVQRELRRAFATARDKAIRFGTVAFDAARAREVRALGAQVLIHSTNLLLAGAIRSYLGAVKGESERAG